MNAKSNPGWDYHIPPNGRMAETNLSSTIHHHAIFQARIGDSNQKNQLEHPEAKPPYPHQ